MGKMNSTKNIWTHLAFGLAILLLFHIMLLPVLYGLSALNPYETDRSVTGAIPKGYMVSAAVTLSLSITCLFISRRVDGCRK